MLRTKNLIDDINKVPHTWVFEFYLQLSERLTGQDMQLHSVFGGEDKRPSLFIFYSTISGKYKFKDFSAQKHGDGITLVESLFSLNSRGEAIRKIISDYNKFLEGNAEYTPIKLEPAAKYLLESYEVRGWNSIDKEYWMRYHIGSKLLAKFNVKPLEFFVLKKEGTTKRIDVRTPRIYGFFKNDGTLYKIYRPTAEKNKFFKVCEYVQGTEQLTYKKPYLCILSSLKDMMAFEVLKYKNVEVLAVDSETSLLNPEFIEELKGKYKKVCTLFDYDEAGVKGMVNYKENFELPGVLVQMEKDLARSIKVHGVVSVREIVTPILRKALKE